MAKDEVWKTALMVKVWVAKLGLMEITQTQVCTVKCQLVCTHAWDHETRINIDSDARYLSDR